MRANSAQREWAIEALPRPADYLVDIVFDGIHARMRSLVWRGGEHEVALDHPATHFLRHAEKEGKSVISLCVAGESDPISVLAEKDLEKGIWTELTDEDSGQVFLSVRVRRLERPTPGFLLNENASQDVRGAVPGIPHNPLALRSADGDAFYISSGISDVLWGFDRAIDQIGDRYIGRVDQEEVFNLVRTQNGAQVFALKSGAKIFVQGQRPMALQADQSPLLSDKHLDTAIITWKYYWWSIRKMAAPPMTDAEEAEDLIIDVETRAFHKMLHVLGAIGIVILLAFKLNPSPNELSLQKPDKPAPPTVLLKAPKVIEVPAKPKPPEPKPKQEVAPEPPKPEVKKPEPKPAKKLEPKPAPKKPEAKRPEPKRPAPPKPAPRQVLPPAPQPVAKPVIQPPVAKAPEPVKPTLPPPPTPEQIAAQQEAVKKAEQKERLTKSLGFLSNASQKVSKPVVIQETSNDQKYDQYSNAPSNMTKTDPKGNYLAKVTEGVASGNQSIQTSGSRSMQGDAGVGKGKSMNGVQARVGSGEVHGGGGALGASVSTGGLQMSGPGQISEAEVLKVLQKYLQRFQYCYEKALLTTPTMSGNLMMQWTIQPNGRASNVQVVRSQLNSPPLHDCVSKELMGIAFPLPKGGAATIKYPFTFSSSL